MAFLKHITISKPALKITLIYSVIGLLWIFFSDFITFSLSIDLEQSKWFSLLKGTLYVFATSCFLYWLIKKQINRINGYVQLLNSKNRLMNFIMQKQSGILMLVIDNEGKIIFASGTEEISDQMTLNNLPGLYLKEWLQEEEWYNIINNVIKNTFQYQNSNIDIEVLGKYYHIIGNIYQDTISSIPFACIHISNTTDISQIIELNSIQKVNIESLTHELNVALEQIKFKQEMLEGFLNGLSESIFIHTLDNQSRLGHLLKVNLSATLMFNCKSSDLLENDIFNFLTFSDVKAITQLHENDFNKTPSLTFNAKLHPLRSKKQIEVEIKTRLIAFDKQKYAITIIRDQTETISAIYSLQSEKDKLSEYYNYLDEGVLIIDKEFNTIFSNKPLESLFEVKPDPKQIIGWISIMEEQLGFSMKNAITQAFEGQTIAISFKKFIFQNKWISIRIQPLINNNAKFIIITVHSVTDLMNLEMQVVELKHRVESGDMLRSVFLSNLSHEIRTPMNGMIGFIDLMEMEKLTKIQNIYLILIKQSSQHLLNIIEAIYEISYLQNNNENIKNTWFKPVDILNELFDYTSAMLTSQKKNMISLDKNIEDQINEMLIYSDRDKLVKALKHICHNAVKFTKKGSIVISTQLSSNDSMTFIISDTGIGIESGNMTAIFLPFISFNTNSEEIYSGIGLGLAISKALIEILGGSIEVESQVNRGTAFYISIPLKLSNRSVQSVIGAKDFNKIIKKVMIVQYNFEGIATIEELFLSFNINVIKILNGMSAIETFYEHQDIDIVICDIRLSDMDAFEVFRAIKRINPVTIFIAQTAYFLADERCKCLDAGFFDYIVKPITSSTIIGILTKSNS